MTDQDIINAANNHLTMSEAARSLNLHFSTFIRKAKSLNVYKPNSGKKGRVTEEVKEKILSGNHTMKSLDLKKKLIKLRLKENVCEHCGIFEWNGKTITLELDHIDGNNQNNLLNNLQILCPNCHSQTPTWRGRGGTGYKK